ncbi:MAG: RNA polymerase sigma factor [Bacteroidales bacterium]|nr:RNA polymerase sigma factor [Bacteroidales bacterium]MCF8343460.1 RNA polymerase sigma factor [Bacteroidales bacterium]MCF8375666.1 RNA polymerase sigma factor [Bacteroidales bacterium]MCF8401464.1 RNA polymerase sigma factor [Bacteroidales bacterium]
MTAIEFNYKLTNLNPNLEYFAQRLTGNSDDAKDLIQETFLKALTYREKYVRHSNFKAWVFTIMKNIFINNYRRAKRANTIIDSTENHHYINNSKEEHYARPDSVFAANELKSAIRELDADYRRAFEMYNEGYKYKEIAEKLDLSIGTVKSRIFFVRQKLMKKLQEYNPN